MAAALSAPPLRLDRWAPPGGCTHRWSRRSGQAPHFVLAEKTYEILREGSGRRWRPEPSPRVTFGCRFVAAALSAPPLRLDRWAPPGGCTHRWSRRSGQAPHFVLAEKTYEILREGSGRRWRPEPSPRVTFGCRFVAAALSAPPLRLDRWAPPGGCTHRWSRRSGRAPHFVLAEKTYEILREGSGRRWRPEPSPRVTFGCRFVAAALSAPPLRLDRWAPPGGCTHRWRGAQIARRTLFSPKRRMRFLERVRGAVGAPNPLQE